MSIGQMLRQWLVRIEYVSKKILFFLSRNSRFFPRWYDTLFPRIPVPTQKEIMEKLHAHGPYKGGNHGAHSRYVRWQVSKDAMNFSIVVHSPRFYFFSFSLV